MAATPVPSPARSRPPETGRAARSGSAALAALLAAAAVAGCGDAAAPAGPGLRIAPLEAPAVPGAALPNLAALPDGGVALSWVEGDGGGESRLAFAVLPGGGEAAWGRAGEVARGEGWFVNWADFPSLAALPDGTWMAHWLRRSGEGTYDYEVRFALSRDGGASWSEPAVLHEDRRPAEHGFVSLAPLAGPEGPRFGALWLDGRHAAGLEGSMALYYRTVAPDGGLGPEVELDPRVCDCCQTALQALPGGGLVAAWRDRSERETRDVAGARLTREGWSAPRPVHPDGWEIPGCPVNGPVSYTHLTLPTIYSV